MAFTDDEIAQLYARYAPVLYHRCLGILRDEQEARDALQDTFAKVIQRSEDFRAQSSPLTWMYAISTHHCLNLLRDRRARAQKLRDHAGELAGDEASAEGSSPDHAVLRALLDETDPQTRAVVLHTWFDDCTREETARLVGISVPTVRKRLDAFLAGARAKLALASALCFALSPGLLRLGGPS